MSNLGTLYQFGHGVAQDYAKAREWYERGADAGDANSMSNLGALYLNGYGVPPDYVKAREWFEKAAENGVSMAMFNLGVIYANGYGVAKGLGRSARVVREGRGKRRCDSHARAWCHLRQRFRRVRRTMTRRAVV